MRRLAVLGALALSTFTMFACSDDSSSDGGGDTSAAGASSMGGADTGGADSGTGGDSGMPTLETDEAFVFYSFWTAPGEADALDALLTELKARTALDDSSIVNGANEDQTNARENLQNLIDANTPPDTFQQLAGPPLKALVAAGKLDPIDDLAAEWKDKFPQAVLDTMSVDGKLYCVPIASNRTNSMFFNKAVLEENNVEVPTTIAEFEAAAATLKANGVMPLVVGTDTDPEDGETQGWIATLVAVQSLMPAMFGTQFYEDFLTGKITDKAMRDEKIRELLTKVGEWFEAGYIDSTANGWGDAANQMATKQAAFTIMGDWVKPYLETDRELEGNSYPALQNGVDFDEVPAFDPDTYVFDLGCFPLPKLATNKKSARAFLEVVASPEAQVGFALEKGSVPLRSDVDTSAFDSRQTSKIAALSDPLTKSTPASVHLNPVDPELFALFGDYFASCDAGSCDIDAALTAINGLYPKFSQ